MSEASLDTSVPDIPMAIPTSAYFIAGASLTPSPVTATTLPLAFNSFTIRSFNAGVLRAITDILSSISFNSESGIFSISCADTTKEFSFIIFSCFAIALAVTR